MLTACGAGDSDSSSGKASDGANSTGFPAPVHSGGDSAQVAPTGEPEPTRDNLSTFALDVDTASYGYARRTLAEGRRPDPATIRPEEFVNSFRQDYRRPDGNGFTVTVDGGTPRYAVRTVPPPGRPCPVLRSR